jgi:hypothetical protein
MACGHHFSLETTESANPSLASSTLSGNRAQSATLIGASQQLHWRGLIDMVVETIEPIFLARISQYQLWIYLLLFSTFAVNLQHSSQGASVSRYRERRLVELVHLIFCPRNTGNSLG